MPEKSEKRGELHELVDKIPEWRLGEAVELIQQQFFPPARRRQSGLLSFVGMMRSGDPDFADKSAESLYEQERKNEESEENPQEPRSE